MGLYLSDVLGGPDQLSKLYAIEASAFCKIKEGYMSEMLKPDDGILNVVFHYPGLLLQPGFQGIRTGSFSKVKKILVIQVAVPEEMLASRNFMKYYIECLKESILIAKKYFIKKNINFSLDDHMALVERSDLDLKKLGVV